MPVFSRVTVGEWVTIAAFVIGGIFWAAHLEGRVNAQERDSARLESHQKEAIDQVREDLAYIRTRLDETLDRGLR